MTIESLMAEIVRVLYSTVTLFKANATVWMDVLFHLKVIEILKAYLRQ